MNTTLKHTPEAPALWLPRLRYQRSRPQLVTATRLPRSAPRRPARQSPAEERGELARLVRLIPARIDLADYELVPLRNATRRRQRRPAAPTSAAMPEPLSERECEVLSGLADGLSNAELARRLAITAGTVRWHLGNIYGKLGVARRTQAVARARALGLLPA